MQVLGFKMQGLWLDLVFHTQEFKGTIGALIISSIYFLIMIIV